MPRPNAFVPLLLAATLAISACGDDTPTAPSEPPPVAITETLSGSLNPNGGRTHQIDVQRAGNLTATLTALSPDDTVTVGLSLGTWNGSSCQIIIAKDDAVLNSVVIGAATGTGLFCVRVYDVGRLTASTEYTVTVEHF
jgi:hypothetical protein